MMTSGLMGLLRQNISAPALDRVGAHIESVERALQVQTQSTVETVEEVGVVTLSAGGKRLRPALVAVAAFATDSSFDHERAVNLGASLELIHMATLIHDDVIDESKTRRGRPTAASLHGNTAAILSGDVLLSRAMRMLAVDGDLRIIRMVSEAVVELAEGEVRELEVRGLFGLDEAEHRRILEKKTAALISCACRVGAILADADDVQLEALTLYGHHLGMAFQIVDDLLDFRGDHVKTGKPWATDFREGQATLPLIFLRETLAAEEAKFTESLFGNGVKDNELEEICGWMDSRGAFVRAQESARDETCKAVAQLERLPYTPYRDLLESVAKFVTEREA